MPLEGWPADGAATVQMQYTGQASTSAEGICQDGRARLTAELPLQGVIEIDQACGEICATRQVDEVKSWQFSRGFDWHKFTGGLTGSVRVRGYERSAAGSIQLSTRFVGAADSSGNPIAVQVCSASGTRY